MTKYLNNNGRSLVSLFVCPPIASKTAWLIPKLYLSWVLQAQFSLQIEDLSRQCEFPSQSDAQTLVQNSCAAWTMLLFSQSHTAILYLKCLSIALLNGCQCHLNSSSSIQIEILKARVGVELNLPCCYWWIRPYQHRVKPRYFCCHTPNTQNSIFQIEDSARCSYPKKISVKVSDTCYTLS